MTEEREHNQNQRLLDITNWRTLSERQSLHQGVAGRQKLQGKYCNPCLVTMKIAFLLYKSESWIQETTVFLFRLIENGYCKGSNRSQLWQLQKQPEQNSLQCLETSVDYGRVRLLYLFTTKFVIVRRILYYRVYSEIVMVIKKRKAWWTLLRSTATSKFPVECGMIKGKQKSKPR